MTFASSQSSTDPFMTISILSLHSYPIKSCASIDHDVATATVAGLEWDRRWVMVDGAGQFMTQRQYPRMALIRPHIDAEYLRIELPEMSTVRIRLHPEQRAMPVPVRIWRADTLGQDEGDAVAQSLSRFMGLACRLLRVHPDAKRAASPSHVQAWRTDNEAWAAQFPVRHDFGFADGFPFLFTSQASLDELNRCLTQKGQPHVPMDRFRPNIVLQGLEPYDEDYLRGIRLPELSFAFVKRCARCPMPNVDQATGVMHEEPGLALAKHRRFDDGVLFGVNAIASHDNVQLRIGQSVQAEFDL
jgi:uncharacterized protein YcbX